MCEKLKIGLRKKNVFKARNYFSKIFFNEKYLNEIEDNNEKYEIDSAIKFSPKFIK